jgi:hypothetical protein
MVAVGNECTAGRGAAIFAGEGYYMVDWDINVVFLTQCVFGAFDLRSSQIRRNEPGCQGKSLILAACRLCSVPEECGKDGEYRVQTI